MSVYSVIQHLEHPQVLVYNVLMKFDANYMELVSVAGQINVQASNHLTIHNMIQFSYLYIVADVIAWTITKININEWIATRASKLQNKTSNPILPSRISSSLVGRTFFPINTLIEPTQRWKRRLGIVVERHSRNAFSKRQAEYL